VHQCTAFVLATGRRQEKLSARACAAAGNFVINYSRENGVQEYSSDGGKTWTPFVELTMHKVK
jgi:hypothetical protein